MSDGLQETPERRRVDWSEHAGKIVLGSPSLAAAVSWAVMIAWVFYRGPGRPPLPPAGMVALFVNAALAVIGSAVGGLLIRDTLPQRIAVAVLAAGFGFIAYWMLIFCPGALGPPTH